jgi:hypothetical protein
VLSDNFTQKERLPMELSHTEQNLHSAAAQRLSAFITDRREEFGEETHNFERFEQELHTLVMVLEGELVGEELSRYDLSAEEIEVEGKAYQVGIALPETYLCAAGLVTVNRHLYHLAQEAGKSICPLELRVGIIGGYFTPRAARQGAFVMAHLTSGESEALFSEVGNMQPSRSSLDRLPKELSPHWEQHRVGWEMKLRQCETIPNLAKTMALSVDGVMAPMRGVKLQEKAAKAQQSGKHASGPTGYKEVGCGTVTLYDQEAKRLQTIRYGRMPETKKATLQQQLETEARSTLALCPTLRRVHLADGAHHNWFLLNEIEQHLPSAAQPPIEIVDYYHACDHLKEGCDAAWGESTVASKSQFERLKTLLKEAEDGAQRVIRALRYQRNKAKGYQRTRLDRELTYFCNQRHRMHYANYLSLQLPIASGVMEASCKTLVTQRFKRSGMAWTIDGGQAILTLRSLIQSERWASAWQLLQADFRIEVKVIPKQPNIPGISPRLPTSLMNSAYHFSSSAFANLPLAV